jgi:hypothetical protein
VKWLQKKTGKNKTGQHAIYKKKTIMMMFFPHQQKCMAPSKISIAYSCSQAVK